MENQEIHDLADQLFAQPLAVLDQQAKDWQGALHLWLNSRHSPHTQRVYLKSLQGCMQFVGKPAWEISRTDVARWVADLKQRGLADTSIAQSLAAVSSFYRFVIETVTRVDVTGKEVPLHNHNPAAGKELRPRVNPYGRAAYLSQAETRALLQAIDRKTVRGMRDYALILGFLFTGRRNSEWRTARWGSFEKKGEQVYFRYTGKGNRESRVEIAPPVWEALLSFLAASGNRKPKADDYLFTPLSDNAVNLPNIASWGWNRNRPISSREMLRILKMYARKAGLDPEKVKVHMLRHTAAMLRKEAGEDIQTISNFLGHKSISTTQIYVHIMEGKADVSWSSVARMLGLQ